MARASTTEVNQASVQTGWAYISLHSADPGTTGASEISGGTYARVAVTWNAPAAGVSTNVGAISINLPASTTAAFIGVWSAITAGTYMFGGALSPNVTNGVTPGAVSIAAGAISMTVS
jgi:hypothetical protein